jgi:hypothetical protein
MSDVIEDTAQQIAEQGREALVERLRPAFKEAAAAHSDVLPLDDDQIEEMVQRAADRADGLQWRRALASVASQELGIGLGEALAHPAVARAQEIVRAPSYEEALAAVTAGRAPDQPTLTDTRADFPYEPEETEETEEAEDHLGPVEEAEADEDEDEFETEATTEAEADDELETEATTEAELAAPPAGQTETVKFNAVHVGGLAGLPQGASDLELHFSVTGFGIVRGTQPLGRIGWSEITAVEIPTPSGRRRRRKGADGTIVIRSGQGSATFEVPGMSAEELGEQLGPLLKEHP